MMENRNRQERLVWKIAQLGHSIFWAAIVLLSALIFSAYENFEYIFFTLIFIAGAQVTVLDKARRHFLKYRC
jgi:hypothetical protein